MDILNWILVHPDVAISIEIDTIMEPGGAVIIDMTFKRNPGFKSRRIIGSIAFEYVTEALDIMMEDYYKWCDRSDAVIVK